MLSAEIPRFKFIQLDAICGDSGENISVELSDFDSMVMQHEIDHLEGITLLDRARDAGVPVETNMSGVGHARFGFWTPSLVKYLFKMYFGRGWKKDFRVVFGKDETISEESSEKITKLSSN